MEKERGIKITQLPIVGTGYVGKTVQTESNKALRALEAFHDDKKIIVIGDIEKDFDFEIEGIKYKQKFSDSKNQFKPSGYMRKILMMSQMFASLDPYQPKQKSFEKPKVNIISEFELIQKKQSKLSANQRKWVINQFNNIFEQIK